VISEKGSAPTEQDVDAMIAGLASGASTDGGVDEQAGERIAAGLETAKQALENLASGKIFGGGSN